MNKSIIIGCERWYSWQNLKYKSFFDNNNRSCRYLNGGGIVGFAKPLRQLFKALVTVTRNVVPRRSNDQYFLGEIYAKQHSVYNMQLDYNENIFNVINPKNCSNISQTYSQLSAVIVHVCWRARFGWCLNKLYNSLGLRHV